jgi:hypothetical protein
MEFCDVIKACRKIPFHTHYTPLLPSARIISVPLPFEKKVYSKKKIKEDCRK